MTLQETIADMTTKEKIAFCQQKIKETDETITWYKERRKLLEFMLHCYTEGIWK
jgi:hypothetical protein